MRWSPRTSTRRHSTRTVPGCRVAQSDRFGEVLPRPDGLGPEEGTAGSGGAARGGCGPAGGTGGPAGRWPGGPADRLTPHRCALLCLCLSLCLCVSVSLCLCVCLCVYVSVSLCLCAAVPVFRAPFSPLHSTST